MTLAGSGWDSLSDMLVCVIVKFEVRVLRRRWWELLCMSSRGRIRDDAMFEELWRNTESGALCC
jgi:hypothetical protein